jgi:hypothetical protein
VFRKPDPAKLDGPMGASAKNGGQLSSINGGQFSEREQ